MSEVTRESSRLPKPIAQMSAWDFWADPYSVGLRDEDAEVVRTGHATEEELARIAIHVRAAMNALIAVGGVEHGRPS